MASLFNVPVTNISSISREMNESLECSTPKSIKECTQPDKTAAGLKTFASILSGNGIYISIALSLAALIYIIINSFEEEYYGDKHFVFERFFPQFIILIICSVIVLCSVLVAASLLNGISEMLQYSKITAKIALYNTTKTPHVLATIANSASTAVESNAPDVVIVPQETNAEESHSTPRPKFCPSCGFKNEESTICNRCGRKLS